MKEMPGITTITAIALCLSIFTHSASAQISGSAERGAQIVAQWCTECHATGTTRRAADVGPTFPEVASTRSPDYLRGFLANPHVRGLMPPFDLATQQIEDIIAYLRTLE